MCVPYAKPPQFVDGTCPGKFLYPRVRVAAVGLRYLFGGADGTAWGRTMPSGQWSWPASLSRPTDKPTRRLRESFDAGSCPTARCTRRTSRHHTHDTRNTTAYSGAFGRDIGTVQVAVCVRWSRRRDQAALRHLATARAQSAEGLPCGTHVLFARGGVSHVWPRRVANTIRGETRAIPAQARPVGPLHTPRTHSRPTTCLAYSV
jgi:hypothetical protein